MWYQILCIIIIGQGRCKILISLSFWECCSLKFFADLQIILSPPFLCCQEFLSPKNVANINVASCFYTWKSCMTSFKMDNVYLPRLLAIKIILQKFPHIRRQK